MNSLFKIFISYIVIYLFWKPNFIIYPHMPKLGNLVSKKNHGKCRHFSKIKAVDYSHIFSKFSSDIVKIIFEWIPIYLWIFLRPGNIYQPTFMDFSIFNPSLNLWFRKTYSRWYFSEQLKSLFNSGYKTSITSLRCWSAYSLTLLLT